MEEGKRAARLENVGEGSLRLASLRTAAPATFYHNARGPKLPFCKQSRHQGEVSLEDAAVL